MKSLLGIALLLLQIGTTAQGIGGDWQGTLQAGPSTLRVRLHVLSSGDSLKATFDAVDQGVNDLPVNSISVEPPTVRFSIDLIRASFDGKIKEDGSAIEGNWIQGQRFPLTLSRVTTATSALAEQKPKFDPAAIRLRLLRHAPAGPDASPRVSRLRQEISAAGPAALTRFWDEVRASGTPLIEPVAGESHVSLVTFLWRGGPDTRHVALAGGVAGSDPLKHQMTLIESSDVWYKTYKIGNDARFTYALSPNDSLEPMDRLDPNDLVAMLQRTSTFQRDPLNPKQVYGSLPSLVELSEAPPSQWTSPSTGRPKGTVKQETLSSRILKNQRNVWIYTPPGFRADGPHYPLLVAFDGAACTSAAGIPLPTILDNLIDAKRIPPIVAVILDNATATSRNSELACSSDFTTFLSDEVVPWMRERFQATTNANQTVAAGSSIGGLAALCAGLQKNLVFGRVLAQSAAAWWVAGNPEAAPGRRMQDIAETPKRNLRIFMDVGLMETDAVLGQSMLSSNRHLRDVLKAQAYPLLYREFLSGHELVNWRGDFAEGLMFLIGEK